MLQKVDSFMTQSPDVRGIHIDFGDAPAHGRWRVTSMVVTFDSGRSRVWRKRWANGFGGHIDTGFRKPPGPYERVVHIQLKTWELTDDEN